MAQIDHEEGNQSVLGEVLAHIIIPPPLEKKKKSKSLLAIVSG